MVLLHRGYINVSCLGLLENDTTRQHWAHEVLYLAMGAMGTGGGGR